MESVKKTYKKNKWF